METILLRNWCWNSFIVKIITCNAILMWVLEEFSKCNEIFFNQLSRVSFLSPIVPDFWLKKSLSPITIHTYWNLHSARKDYFNFYFFFYLQIISSFKYSELSYGILLYKYDLFNFRYFLSVQIFTNIAIARFLLDFSLIKII